MKRIFRYWAIVAFSLLISQQIGHSLIFGNHYLTVAKVALFLTFFEYFLKPLVKLLLLPVNILTLGTLRWIVDVLALFLAVTFVANFRVRDFVFSGLQLPNLVISPFSFHGFWSYVATAFWLNLIIAVLRWLF